LLHYGRNHEAKKCQNSYLKKIFAQRVANRHYNVEKFS